MTRQAVLRLADDQPTDWALRSALSIVPGLWMMRNGHVARIDKRIDLPYTQGGKNKMFPVWKGVCTECNDPLTWNINGTYAAVGKHAFDILERA